MKCEHCGKNEVTFVYRSSVNGNTTEKHLCGECAERLGYAPKLAAYHQRMMRNFWSDDFFGRSLLDDFFTPMSGLMERMDRMLESPFEDFFAEMPALGPVSERQEAPEQQAEPVSTGEQEEFSELRKLNALRMEMRKAVRREEFEQAARLRDEIRALEAARAERHESR